jgi:hypothetical protein
MRTLRIVLLTLLAIGVSVALAAPAVAADCGQLPVRTTPILVSQATPPIQPPGPNPPRPMPPNPPRPPLPSALLG